MSAVPSSPGFALGLTLDEPLPERPSFQALRASAVPSDAAWARFLGQEPTLAPTQRRLALSLLVAGALVAAVLLGFLTLARPGALRLAGRAAVPESPAPAVVTTAPNTSTNVSTNASADTSALGQPAVARLAPKPLEMPRPALLGSGAGAPGALPSGFQYSYASAWKGWPVLPSDQEHPVRGSFLAPRTLASSYHFGVDISVDDAHPEADVPPALQGLVTHRVVAVDDGVVSLSPDGTGYNAGACFDRHFAVANAQGEFDYWHIYPTAALGQYVHAGDTIGWTCKGAWHLHLSELQYVGGVLAYVNPLHQGGKLVPYRNSRQPLVGKPRLFSPAPHAWCPHKSLGESDQARPQSQWHLKGLVEVRAAVDSPQSYIGFLSRDPLFSDGFTPYRVAVVWWRGQHPVLAVNSFRADTIPTTPYLVHFAPGSAAPRKLQSCLAGAQRELWCGGSFVYRPLSTTSERLLDTRSLKDGPYVVTVYAWNEAGQVGQHSLRVFVDNGSSSQPLAAPRLATVPSGCPLGTASYRVSGPTDS